MSTFVRIYMHDRVVHERELRPGKAGLVDLLDAMEEHPPLLNKGCAVYIAGPKRLGGLVKVAEGGGARFDPKWTNFPRKPLS